MFFKSPRQTIAAIMENMIKPISYLLSHGSPPLTLFVEPLTYSVLRPTARLARPNGLYDSYRLLIRGILIPYKTYYSDIKKCLAFAFAS